MEKKIFKVYNSISQENWVEEPLIEVNNNQELYNIISKYWNVGPSQVQFDYNEYAKSYNVRLTSKTGETFTLIGNINFNPYD